MRARSIDDVEDDLCLAADGGDHCRCRPFERNMHDVNSGHALEQLTDKMAGAARSEGGVVELSRSGPGQRHEFPHVVRGHRGMDGEDERRPHQHRDRREITQRIVGQARIYGGVAAMRTATRLQQCIAVGCRLGYGVSAYAPARADAIFHDDWLPQGTRHLFSDHAGGQIVATAGREGDDEAYRAVGPSLRLHRQRKQKTYGNEHSRNACRRRYHQSGLLYVGRCVSSSINCCGEA